MTSHCETDKHGNEFWYKNGKLHRTDGPASTYTTGDTHWYNTGKLHRDNGPAVEYADGYVCWYQNGNRHRTDGPAVEYADGYVCWWIDGIELTCNEFAAKVLDEETATLWKMSGHHWPFDFGDSK
jgi:hypothetical protein